MKNGVNVMNLPKVYLWSWNPRSVGARELADALDIPRIRHINSRFRPSEDTLIINWGSTFPWMDRYWGLNYFNHPDEVTIVGNKLRFFNRVNEHCRTVPWTVSQDVAREWNQKSSVVVRNLLTSHSGRGIIVVPRNGEIPVAPLYTRYIPKDAEYRIHIVNGEIIDTQRKIRNPNSEPRDWKIRVHSNGFIFIRGGVTIPEDVTRQATNAFTASGLDFGAVDVIWNEKKQQAFILEINSAPGLMNTTVTKYAEALMELIEAKREIILE